MERGELKHTQARLEELIGINYDTFTRTVVLSSGTVHGFLSGGAVQRRVLFEELMGLSHLDAYSESSQRERAEIEKEITGAIATRNEKESQLKRLSETILSVGDEAALGENIRSITKQIAELHEAHRERLKGIEVELADILTRKRSSVSAVSTAELERESEENALLLTIEALKNIISKLRLMVVHSHSMETLHCPTCEQLLPQNWTISKAGIHTELSTMGIQLLSFIDSVSDMKAAVSFLEEELKKLESRLQQLRTRDLRASLETAGFDLELSRLDSSSSKLEAQLKVDESALLFQLKENEANLKRRLDIIREAESLMASSQTEIDKLVEDLRRLNDRFNIAKFWENSLDKRTRAPKSGFSTFRSFLFSNAVSSINEVLEVYTSQLASEYSGGDENALDATLDEELKLKEHYGRRSSGERKRTDLALLLTLFDIARSRTSYRPKYLLLDEVFDSLDRHGMYAVQRVLSTLAEKVPKIFLISHTDIAIGASLAGTIRAEMEKDKMLRPIGTRIKLEEY